MGKEDAGDLIANLEQNKPSMLVTYNCSCLSSNDQSFLKQFPHIYCDPELEDVKILSTIPLDHIKIHKMNEANFICEIALEQYPEMTYVGHLPALDLLQLDTLKSYLIASNPYLKTVFWGDLNEKAVNLPTLWELCVKGDAGAAAEADTKGNKTAKGDFTIRSDDEKYKAKAQIEYTENEKGEKVGKAKVEVRVGF